MNSSNRTQELLEGCAQLHDQSACAAHQVFFAPAEQRVCAGLRGVGSQLPISSDLLARRAEQREDEGCEDDDEEEAVAALKIADQGPCHSKPAVEVHLVAERVPLSARTWFIHAGSMATQADAQPSRDDVLSIWQR